MPATTKPNLPKTPTRADYLDYLHMQKVKKQSKKRISLEHVKQELAIG